MTARSAGILFVLAALPARAETADELIRKYLQQRGTDVQMAKHSELVRRYAIDLTGVIPSAADVAALEGKSPREMFAYFKAKGALPHTRGEQPYVWVNLLLDADHFLFSNSTQFTQVRYIREFRDQLRRLYADGYSYRDFARWALESQNFLSRFPSAADRANASFFLFLGRDSLPNEVPSGNMWNGWVLRNASIPAGQAETNADYHVYVYQPSVCGTTLCTARLWSKTGSTPAEIIELMLASPMFAEAAVDRYWQRLVGRPFPSNDFPDVRRELVRGFIQSGWNVNWLIEEIATSAAYTQEMMFR
ncbi:MAG: DUF1549 domain-containing protein [Myxococcaceae bacterium]|nr:DUF1549 domain-containing protein [Myxococcaceae bacterium]